MSDDIGSGSVRTLIQWELLVERENPPIRILLVEDDEDDYVLVRDLLSHLSVSRYELYWVSDYEAALNAVLTRELDLCILDYRLGDRNGLDLMEDLKRHGCKAPIVFLTGEGGYQVDVEAMKAGVADYLTKKDLTAPLLERSIRFAIERKQKEDELVKAKRIIQALSECNHAVIHLKDELELIREVCRIVVELGGYRMSWVGYAGGGPDLPVSPVAKYGYDQGYLETISITWRDAERGRGPTGTSIRTGAPSIFRFIESHSEFAPWKEDAIKRGYGSVIGLPLLLDDERLGALTIYAEEPDAFDTDELDLLVKLAHNLSYGIGALRNHEARKHAQDALQAERDKFMGILASMEDGVYIANHNHDIEYVNRVIEREFGPVNGRKCYDYLGRAVDVCLRGEGEGVFAGRSVRWVWTSAKTKKTYDSFATPMKNPDGTISKLEIFRDISENKRMERALRESEERYRMLFNKANDAIYLLGITPEGDFSKFIEVNDNLCHMLGYTKEELLSLSLADIVSSEHLEDVLKKKRRPLAEKHFLAERTYVTKSGKKIPVEVNTHVFDNKGYSTFLTIARNITERKRSEEKLRQSEEKYRKLSQELHALLNAIGDTLILLSPDMRVLWANNSNAYQADVLPSEITGKRCYELFFNRAEPCEECIVKMCFATGRKQTHILNHHGRVLDKRAFPIIDGDGVNSVILLIIDITEKITIQAEAMHASHLASLGELAAGVAHEINNPINGIINYAQVIINECNPDSLESDIGNRIVKEGDRIADIVKSLLSFAREGREDKWPTTVGSILKESLVLTQAQIRKEGIRLDIKTPDDLPGIHANFQRMQQVFLNIINNARYALNEKYPRRHENKVLQILGERIVIDDLEYVRITFHDRGVGIPADKLCMLTKPFFSTKPFGKGTGLGLSIIHKIITEHGGRLSFESVEGEFTKVIVDLPAKGPGNG